MFRSRLRKAMAGVMFALVASATGVVVSATPAQAVPEPTTSPAAYSRVFQWNQNFTCESGFACATVPYGGGYYIFKFYYYGTYYMSYWDGIGIAFNNQTDGAAMRLLNSSGGQLQCIAGNIGGVAHFDDWVEWAPVWRIQLTSSLC